MYFSSLRHPFGQTTHTTVWGDLAAIGRTEAYEIKAYRSDGSLGRIVRRDYEPRIPTQAEQDASFRRYVAGLPAERRARAAEVAANVPLVDAFPAFAGAVGDALGHLWIAEFERPGRSTTVRSGRYLIGRGVCLAWSKRPKASRSSRSARTTSSRR